MTAVSFDPPRPRAVRTPRRFRWAVDLLSRQWTIGRLTFVLPDGREVAVGAAGAKPESVIRVRSFRFLARVLASADIGFAEGYMAGDWDTPNLQALLTVLALNFDQLPALTRGSGLARLVEWARHALRRNTRSGSRRNIHAHYDLGEAFYRAWLDPGMTYSSGLYAHGRESLEEAQTAKYRALAQAIDLGPGHSVLEIGCGWGGFAEYAAGLGAEVTAVTISRDQYDYARRRIAERGLADRVEVRLQDYRDLTGRYDRVVSIEMFEAVGEAYWATYFAKVRDSLKPRGRAGLQIITIRDDLYDDYRRQTDFIQKYVFPGGALPSEQRLYEAAGAAGLAIEDIRRLGGSYALTLSEWAARFEAAWPLIRGLGFDARFRRLWRFYLAYCEAGFVTGRTNVVHVALSPA